MAYRIRHFLRLAAGLHYTKLFGYDAYVRNDYDGPSVSLGVELASFE